MRLKKRETDFRAISRDSMRRDFNRVQTYHQKGKRPEIKKQRLPPPVYIGEVIAGNVLGTGVDVVATKTIEEQND